MSSYFGSKAACGLYQPIIAMMPPHDTYIETHLGGGAIMKRKPPAMISNIGIDLDPQALEAFDCDYPVHLVNDCALSFLASYPFTGSELVYSDPPYLLHTRTSGRKYRFDYTESDHIALLEQLTSLPCAVMLSGYSSSLYDQMLAGWQSMEMQAMSRGGPRTEKLWFNYVPDRVHWAGYAGKNFTDRQRIKRKSQRWGKNYEALPRAERVAVLAAMMAVEAGINVFDYFNDLQANRFQVAQEPEHWLPWHYRTRQPTIRLPASNPPPSAPDPGCRSTATPAGRAMTA